MKFKILTIFPQMIENALSESILGRARAAGIIDAQAIDIRPFSDCKHKNTDDTPFGGGAGMVMTPQPLKDCIKYAKGDNFTGRVLYLSPRGQTFTQKKAEELAKCGSLILLCGHYEGIDQRIIDSYIDEEISVGDYVLTGGELGALIITDAVARLIPGVLGCDESSVDESFSSGLLEYPQYTRPREFEGVCVPDVLTGGNQKLIDRWRRDEAIRITYARRPEMLESVPLDKYDRALIRELKTQPSVRIYVDTGDEELINDLSEVSGMRFEMAGTPEGADACVYLKALPESVTVPTYTCLPCKPQEKLFSCAPARFSQGMLELRGDEGIKSARFSQTARAEFACCAAALLPVKRALKYKADYGKGRGAFTGNGDRRGIYVEFFDGNTRFYPLQKRPVAFLKALAAFLVRGTAPVNDDEARAAYNLYRLTENERDL